jgi:hypothetical protein
MEVFHVDATHVAAGTDAGPGDDDGLLPGRRAQEGDDRGAKEDDAHRPRPGRGDRRRRPPGRLARGAAGRRQVPARINGEGYKLVKLEGVKPITGKVGDKPVTTGEPIKEEGGTEHGFADRIKKLKADAHKLNANPKDEKLDELIDKVSEASRGSLRGPAELGPFDIGPGATSTFHFTFVGGEPAHVHVTNQGRGQLKLEIYNEKGGRVTSITGAGELSCDWEPGMTRPFTVYVSNVGRQERNFTVYKN